MDLRQSIYKLRYASIDQLVCYYKVVTSKIKVFIDNSHYYYEMSFGCVPVWSSLYLDLILCNLGHKDMGHVRLTTLLCWAKNFNHSVIKCVYGFLIYMWNSFISIVLWMPSGNVWNYRCSTNKKLHLIIHLDNLRPCVTIIDS